MYYNTGQYIDSTETASTSSTITIDTGNSGVYFSNGSTQIPKDYTVGKGFKFRQPKKKKGAKTRENPVGASPVVVFKILKKNLNFLELGRLNKRLEQISKLLENIPKEQIALTEEFENKALMIIREAEMVSCGFNMFMKQDLVKKFVDRSRNRVIKLTKMDNYSRMIPKKALNKLEKAKSKNLFDGFVVMHTDPNNKSVKKTIEEKKDPILFGVIKESDRYYFIADWEDELCDLTLDKIIDKLGLGEKEYTMEEDFGERFSKSLGIKLP